MARSGGAKRKVRSSVQAGAILAKKRERIAYLYLRGRTQREIAADSEVRISDGNVCRHLKAIREEWKTRATEDYAVRLNRELDKLDALEADARKEYERSQLDAVRKTVENNAGKTKKSIVTEGQCGDPRYLSIIEGLIDKRLKLIGAYAPTKIAPTTPDGKEAFNPFAVLPMEQLLDMAKGASVGTPEG